MSEVRYSYSLDEEYYHGSFQTREEAILAARVADEDATTVWTGINFVPARTIRGEDIIEQVLCSTTEESGDWSEGYLIGVPRDAVIDLSNRMQSVWDEWEKEHSLEPTWFNVEGVKSHHLNGKENK